MGRYSNTGLAHGTNGSPQITVEENTYNIKVEKIYNALKNTSIIKNNQENKKTGISGHIKSQEQKILFEILELILKFGYKKININDTEMYIKNGKVIEISFVIKYKYYLLEKANTIRDAFNNNFKLLKSISNKMNKKDILKTVERILLEIDNE